VDEVVALREALHQLATAADLEGGLASLLADLRQASPSAVGLEVTTVVAGQDVRVAHFLPGVRTSDVVSSLQVPLREETGGASASGPVRVTFYATRPGAFVDLAADLAHAQGLPLDRLELDEARPASTAAGVRGLERVSVIHRAVGVLIAQGVHPDDAQARLAADAAAAAVPLVDHARAVILAAVRAAEARTGHGLADDVGL
jgi:hypothetical protein